MILSPINAFNMFSREMKSEVNNIAQNIVKIKSAFNMFFVLNSTSLKLNIDIQSCSCKNGTLCSTTNRYLRKKISFWEFSVQFFLIKHFFSLVANQILNLT